TSITARTVNQKTTPLGIPNRFNQSEIDSSLLFYRYFRAMKCSISLEITLTAGKACFLAPAVTSWPVHKAAFKAR
ncbi:MAG: hypothetical protein ACR2O7_02105, partial [Parasphingorhabdus sp.]